MSELKPSPFEAFWDFLCPGIRCTPQDRARYEPAVNKAVDAARLLSSPVDARREALEEAAKVAETRHVHWHMPHPDDAFPGEVKCDVTACSDIAAAIRALKETK